MTGTVRAPVSLRVPFAASSVSVARSRIQEWLAEQGGSRDCIDDARLVISELVANAVRHAEPLPDGSLRVGWGFDEQGRLQLSVTDGGGETMPSVTDVCSFALAGRGMSMVESLSSAWWAERSRSRSTVYALVCLS